MKKLLIVGTLLISISGEALSMGHPHNLFAARKTMRSKSSSMMRHKLEPVANHSWQSTVHIDKVAFSKRLLAVLAELNPINS